MKKCVCEWTIAGTRGGVEGIATCAYTCCSSLHVDSTNIANARVLTPLSNTCITHKDTITITSSCPCGYMAGALGSIIEHFSLHQFPQHTFLFTRSSEGWRLAFFNRACIKSNRMRLAEIDSVTRQGYKWTAFLLVTHMHQIKWEDWQRWWRDAGSLRGGKPGTCASIFHAKRIFARLW